MGRIHLPTRGGSRRRCGHLRNYFGHLLFLLLLLLSLLLDYLLLSGFVNQSRFAKLDDRNASHRRRRTQHIYFRSRVRQVWRSVWWLSAVDSPGGTPVVHGRTWWRCWRERWCWCVLRVGPHHEACRRRHRFPHEPRQSRPPDDVTGSRATPVRRH